MASSKNTYSKYCTYQWFVGGPPVEDRESGVNDIVPAEGSIVF